MNELIHVFVGPSLPPSVRPALDAVVYHQPAAQGDVYGLVSSRPLAIAVIDGYFERVPAVWHKELLHAMSRGVHVFGAASMGALRAAELADFGMMGVGSVFEDFARGTLQDDDEVTIVHADASQDFRPGSEAMVNLRATLSLASEQGVLSTGAMRELTAHAKRLFYPDRSYPALLEWAKRHLSPPEEASFRGWLLDKSHRLDVKRRDALELLSVLRDFAAKKPSPKAVPWHFHHTDAWEQLRRTFSQQASAAWAEDRDAARVLARLGAQPELQSKLRQEAELRAMRIRTARQDGYVASDDDKESVLGDLCREHGLTTPSALKAWISRQGVSEAVFERLIDDEACARRSARLHLSASNLDLMDLMRISGAYGELSARDDAD